ncbi:MAG: hypothetical protein JNM86_05665 [Phycisphaerae bacterium]|nr:hypothetical protein [Phycisphaerae bacterium]
MILVINYDLRQPRRDYAKLIEAIKAFDSWCHPLESFWLVDTTRTTGETHSLLAKHVDENDGLFVHRAQKDAAWTGVSKECSDWINNSARRW